AMHTAYQAYYQKGVNSASPRSYAKVLEDLWNGKRVSASSREFLINTMLKTQTGKNRIRQGLKSPLVFAHKTGTHYQRIADVGFLWDPNKPHRKPLLLIAFVRDVKKPKTAAKLMEKVAKTINETGVL